MKIKNAARVMRPAKFWIDGTIYTIGSAEQVKTESIEDKVSSSFRLPNKYYDKLINDPKFNIRSKTTRSVDIFFPKKGIEGNITISGNSLDHVKDAQVELHSMVQMIRQTIKPEQFIAIPTLSSEIRNNFQLFKENLLRKKDSISNLDDSIFQKPEKLHLTVCVFALLDEIEENYGIQLLDELKQDILLPLIKNKNEILINLKGLSSMDSNLKKTNILYANASIVNDSEEFNLQNIANIIAEFFYEKGLMKENKANVKIHVTLINTKYRKSTAGSKKKWAKRIPIDSTLIFEEYKDFDFGTCNFDSVHLSLMSSARKSEQSDGFYAPLSIVKLF